MFRKAAVRPAEPMMFLLSDTQVKKDCVWGGGGEGEEIDEMCVCVCVSVCVCMSMCVYACTYLLIHMSIKLYMQNLRMRVYANVCAYLYANMF